MKVAAVAPTLKLQCVGFMIGSSLFAVGSMPGLSDAMGSKACNVCFFVGSWFFTAAAFVQLQLSGSPRNERNALRALWLAASTQFLGTILFNVSTGSALKAQTFIAETNFVWAPDAEGSVAFLISAGFALLVLVRANALWGPRNATWVSTWVNMLGCVAFGVSAVGAIVLPNGGLRDAAVADWGTLVGAVCFFAASAVVLPQAVASARDDAASPAGTAHKG